MALITENLGNGFTGTYEASTFARLLRDEIEESEEIRKFWSGNYEYACLAPSGSSIYDPVWCAVRTTWLNGKKIRVQYQENMTYSDITNGWTL